MIIDSKVKILATLLTEQEQKLALAESCTGGMLAQFCTNLSGSSNWFERGFVTYSNLAKQQMLGVNPELIQTYGAVSIEVVQAMALGAINNSIADFAVAISGVAGPTGGSADKPVGTVYFGLAQRNTRIEYRHQLFNGSRYEIRKLSCEFALEQLIKFVS